ncbi:hypothetical protein [Maribacter sp. 2307ULW6-5]|uniref:hypothetical protein n=1 Tax=Maribacter sp. 2307ULW6-5 TaxID=3386275 RepID=UPI0039BD4D65
MKHPKQNTANLLFGFCLCAAALQPLFAQGETYYRSNGNGIEKTSMQQVRSQLRFEGAQESGDEVFNLGLLKIASNLIPLLVDEASKLFYDPDNYNKEYAAHLDFFDANGTFRELDPNRTLIFEKRGTDAQGKEVLLSRLEFALGAVGNVEGYHYLGLKAYELNHAQAKLSAAKQRLNYVLDIHFYYFDAADKAQEFQLNPILLSGVRLPSKGTVENVAYQVVPKMKVLQRMQLRVREVNASKQNWDTYLKLYRSNRDQISRFLIRALPGG